MGQRWTCSLVKAPPDKRGEHSIHTCEDEHKISYVLIHKWCKKREHFFIFLGLSVAPSHSRSEHSVPYTHIINSEIDRKHSNTWTPNAWKLCKLFKKSNWENELHLLVNVLNFKSVLYLTVWRVTVGTNIRLSFSKPHSRDNEPGHNLLNIKYQCYTCLLLLLISN